MKISIYSNKKSSKRVLLFYDFLCKVLMENNIDVERFEQPIYFKSHNIKKATYKSDFPKNFKIYNKKSLLPFKITEKRKDFDFEIFCHIISDVDGVFSVKNFYLYDYFYFERFGYANWSEISKIKKENIVYNEVVEEKFKNLSQDYIFNNFSKYKQEKQHKDVVFPENFIFIPTQVFNDSVNNWSRVNFFEFIKKSCDILSEKGFNIVIKRHPGCKNKNVKNLLRELSFKKNIYLFNNSIHDIIEKSKAVMAINSGVGFEALLHEKPVITLGYSDYEIATYSIYDLNELYNIKDILKSYNEEKRKFIKSFVIYVLENKIVKNNDKKGLEKRLRCLGIIE